jgi:hypothetical protein
MIYAPACGRDLRGLPNQYGRLGARLGLLSLSYQLPVAPGPMLAHVRQHQVRLVQIGKRILYGFVYLFGC